MRFEVDPWRAESVEDQLQRLHTNSRSFLGGWPHLASSALIQKYSKDQLVRAFSFLIVRLDRAVNSVPVDGSELGAGGCDEQ
jgi:hypothetical protein